MAEPLLQRDDEQSRLDVIILAGGRGPSGELWAMEAIAGRPMLWWLLRAFAGAGLVDHVAVVGPSADRVEAHGMALRVVASGTDMVDSLLRGRDALQRPGRPAHTLICPGDMPLVTAEALRDFVARCTPAGGDLYYGYVEQARMERAYPGCGRSYVPARGDRVCGIDLVLVRSAVAADEQLCRELSSRRKSYLSLAARAGPLLLLGIMLRRLSPEQVIARAGRLIGVDARPVRGAAPCLAMDIDRREQLRYAAPLLQADADAAES